MRKVLCSLLALGTFVVTLAQEKNYIKPGTLALSFSGTDFKSAAAIRRTSLSDAISNKNLGLKNIWSGVSLSYLKGVTKNIDFVGSLNSTFVYYPFRTESVNVNRTRHLLLAADAGFNIKLLSDKNFLVPYLSAGIGGFKYDTASGGYIPLGFGLQFSIKRKAFILLNAQYRLPITNEANYHFFFSLGVGVSLGKQKKTARTSSPKVIAQKNEPIIENVKPAVVPDTDGDGILDDVDKCPTVPGIAKYQGCPIPDTDKDGVNDDEDRCPTVPGVAKYQGCPIPDTDGDGVNDEIDKCPTIPGPASNNGCPVKAVTEEMRKKIDMAAKEIYFETAKATLLPKSFPQLNAVVEILKANEYTKIEVDGHTDNVGTDEHNKTLSENRAAAVTQYLLSKGIAADRMVSKGFGGTMPIDTNTTPSGKAKNRRVEIKITDF